MNYVIINLPVWSLSAQGLGLGLDGWTILWSYLGHVGYGNVPGFSADTYGEVCFEGRLIEAWKGLAGMSRLKLG